MGGSEKRRDPASDAGATASTINDWTVDQTKRRFRDRLLEAAGRLAGGARLKGKTRLTHHPLLERELPAHLLTEEEQAVVAQYRRLGPERRQTWLSIGGLLEAEASAPGPDGPSAHGPGPAP